MSERNSISDSYKSQQSVDSTTHGVVFEKVGGTDVLVHEEDLQNEQMDCPGGECTLNSHQPITPDADELALKESTMEMPTELPDVVDGHLQEEDEGDEAQEVLARETTYQPAQVEHHQQQDSHQKSESVTTQLEAPVPAMATTDSVGGHVRPATLGHKCAEERKSVENSPVQAEEKVLSQIRAKKNVANLIAKFNSGIVEEQPTNGASKQKMEVANSNGGSGKIHQMRQKFDNK